VKKNYCFRKNALKLKKKNFKGKFYEEFFLLIPKLLVPIQKIDIKFTNTWWAMNHFQA